MQIVGQGKSIAVQLDSVLAGAAGWDTICIKNALERHAANCATADAPGAPCPGERRIIFGLDERQRGIYLSERSTGRRCTLPLNLTVYDERAVDVNDPASGKLQHTAPGFAQKARSGIDCSGVLPGLRRISHDDTTSEAWLSHMHSTLATKYVLAGTVRGFSSF
ncbi:hypothetical protein ASD92_17910 [Massilia sp. Root1485]|nr:hypothetical protein ASD92_17910 [Massilia sp. Root1485]